MNPSDSTKMSSDPVEPSRFTGDEWELPRGSPFPSADNPRYVIQEKLDHGGMGVVYEAVQRGLGLVAIKVVKPRALSPDACERFLIEAKSMARVRGESGVANIYECDWYADPATSTRAPFIVMEHIRGARGIDEYLAARQPPRRERIELLARVCEAVGAAHRVEIIHRDLKPANILVDVNGVPKVIDFGLALAIDPMEGAERLPSERGGLFGTLPYMSPEQAAKHFDPHALTPASDVYSLGVLTYESLLGRLPYDRDPVETVVVNEGLTDYREATRIIRDEPCMPPRRVDRSIHPSLEAILLKALEKDPKRRYANAAEFARALRRHLAWSIRLDLAKCVPIVLLAVWLAYQIGVPLVYKWTPLNLWFHQLVVSGASNHEDLKNVVILAATSETDDRAMSRIAADPRNEHAFELEDVAIGLGKDRSSRPLWGLAVSRLAKMPCGVIALDIYQSVDSPWVGADEAMLRGIREAQDAGRPVVFGYQDWPRADRSYPIAPRLFAGMEAMPSKPTYASLTVSVGTGDLFGPYLIMDPFPNKPYESLALASYLRWLSPKQPWDIGVDEFNNEVVVRFDDSTRLWQGPKDLRIPVAVFVAGTEMGTSDAPNARVLTASDRFALYAIGFVPTGDALARATVELSAFLTMDEAKARELVRDKVVVLGGQQGEEDLRRLPDGRRVYGCSLQAVAIESLIGAKAPVQSAGFLTEVGSTIFGAAIGLALTFVFIARPISLTCATVGVIAAACAGGVASFRVWSVAFNPMVPVLALLVAVGCSIVSPRILRRFGM